MNILLADEEIGDAKRGHTAIMEAHPNAYESDKAIALAQARKIVGWVENHSIDLSLVSSSHSGICFSEEAWQELKKEIEKEGLS